MSTDAPAADTSNDPIIGKVIDGCRIQRKLGQGGMGVVYLAEHDALKQPFVIKILNPSLVGADDTVERFFREAQACAQLNHAGIVAIQNVGQEGEYYFIRMEYIEGKTLEDKIREVNQLDWRIACQIVIDTAEALSHAHQKGMIHRDIKPENIMLTPDNHVKVMDFGLAKHVHSNAKVSVTGQIVGTPFFMSPEQAGGKPTDARSDIYSLGVTLYYLVTGVKPFNGKNLQEIFLKHFFYAPESPKIYNGELPESLCEVVKKCLKKKKKERYQSAKEMARDLAAILEDPNAVVAKDSAPGGDEEEAKAPAPAGKGDEVGGQTVRAQIAPDDVGGGTVRVGGDGGDGTIRVSDGTVQVDDAGGGTVKVGQEDSDNATVAVKSKGKRAPGEVGTISFGEDGGVTVRVGGDAQATAQLDPDHPAHGLDLPTSVIQEATGQKPADAPKPFRRSANANRPKQLIVAGVILVPLVLLGGMEVHARSTFSRLAAAYDARVDDPVQLDALAEEMEHAPLGAFHSKETEIKGMATNLREQAENARKREADEAAARKAEQERKTREEEARKKRIQIQETVTRERGELQTLKAQRKWSDYATKALALFKSCKENGLEELVEGLRIPVQVVTDPPGAEVVVDGDPTAETQPTPGVTWVAIMKNFVLKVRKRGFNEVTVPGAADAPVPPVDASLERHVRRELSLGDVQERHGARVIPRPLLPTGEVAIDLKEGVAYFVGHDGLLRAFTLGGLRPGAWAWAKNSDQQVGVYGDPTPAPLLIPGQAVLVSSLRGFVTAHFQQNDGRFVWKAPADVGAPVTSPPAYLPQPGGNQGIVAAGTASGEVVFVDPSGAITWRFPTENAIVSAPLFQGERAFVGSTDDRMYAVDWAHRQKLGVLEVGDDVVVGPLAIGRALVLGTAHGGVYLVDAKRPDAMRIEKELVAPRATPVRPSIEVVADQVFVSVGRDVKAFKVAAQGAELVWERQLPAELTRPTISNDVVYLGAANGVLYALSQADGEIQWRFTVPVAGAKVSLAPVVVDRELFVFAGNRIVVLDAE